MTRAGFCLLALATLLISACLVQPSSSQSFADWRLLPPAEGPPPRLSKQRVTLLADQREQQFMLVSRFDHERLKLVVLLPGGARLLTLEYDGTELTQQSFSGFELPAEEILALLQFASWPPDSLTRHYPEAQGFRVIATADERRLLTESDSLLTIGIHPAGLQIDNHPKEYRVIVQTLEVTDL